MSRRLVLAALVVLPVVALVGVIAVWRASQLTSVPPTSTTTTAVGTVQALHDLVAASDAVVVAEVVAVDADRTTLQADEVLAGVDPGSTVAVVGSPPEGLAPAAVGEVGIWFLVADASEPGTFRVIDQRGRYLVSVVEPDAFTPSGIDDPFVLALEGTQPIILRHQVQEAGRPPR